MHPRSPSCAAKRAHIVGPSADVVEVRVAPDPRYEVQPEESCVFACAPFGPRFEKLQRERPIDLLDACQRWSVGHDGSCARGSRTELELLAEKLDGVVQEVEWLLAGRVEDVVGVDRQGETLG